MREARRFPGLPRRSATTRLIPSVGKLPEQYHAARGEDGVLGRPLEEFELPIGQVASLQDHRAVAFRKSIAYLGVRGPKRGFHPVSDAGGDVVELIDLLVVAGSQDPREQAKGAEDPYLRLEAPSLDVVLEQAQGADVGEVEVASLGGVFHRGGDALPERSV